LNRTQYGLIIWINGQCRYVKDIYQMGVC